ncbi:hypothetical protein E4U14_007185 [Claviceps sp. LM454 group G7]|nr:hypothetical protein E4U14_007185 [Claviceps sp. LM454 group G7]
MYALSLLALLLPLAAANDHLKCDCMSWSEGQNWIHNAQLTHYVCSTYYKDNAVYDAHGGRCIAEPGYKISGQPWEDLCKSAGADGFYPIVVDQYGSETVDKSKKPLTIGAAAGSCPDRGD